MKARELGADSFGVAPALLPPPSQGGGDAYRKWLAEGMHGAMDYMENESDKREDVTAWFERAKSVIMCGFSCVVDEETAGPGQGRLARYARVPNYHPLLEKKMRALREYLEELVPPWAPHNGSKPRRGRIFIDTSPILERLYARYAGLGWVGKNTMLLSRDAGSLFLIAGLAVDVDLVYDEPVTDHCGSCTRCLDACPTDAFPQANVLDASKCIAYFTVENPGAGIPPEFRAGHGDWIFGCDVCQDVCPWNKFAVKSRVFEPLLPPGLDLEELAAMSEAQFFERYKGTALPRTGRQALVRNALLAMGNSGDSRYRGTLERYAAGEDAVLADQAKWSLEKIGAARAGEPSDSAR